MDSTIALLSIALLDGELLRKECIASRSASSILVLVRNLRQEPGNIFFKNLFIVIIETCL